MFNKKLHKRLERFDVVSDGKFYTNQEQHLNSTGKENMSKKIVTAIEYLCNKKVELISGKWYKNEKIKSPDHQAVQDVIGSNSEDVKKVNGIAHAKERQVTDKKCDGIKRPRRQPVTRNQDFLWLHISKN